jgi:lysine biosynthesis protein LysW
MLNARCPICSSDVIIEDEAFQGDLITCSICSNELEILSLHPLQLSPLNAESDTEVEEEL